MNKKHPTKFAVCHTDRVHHCKGLCINCYILRWKANNREKVNGYARADYVRNQTTRLAQRKAWRDRNPDYMTKYHRTHAAELLPGVRDRAYRKKYGISLEQYDEIFQKQKGLCALCLRPSKTYKLAVDHDHKTKKIRGLLCLICNRVVLSRIDLIPGYLERITDYVK